MRLSLNLCMILILLTAGQSFATETQQFNYMVNCQGCHLPDGRGYPERNVPDLRDHLGKFLFVSGGREFIVQVPGAAQSDLDSQDLADLLNWMLLRFSSAHLPSDFKPFNQSEVESLRQEPLVRVSEVRERLIAKIKEYEATLR